MQKRQDQVYEARSRNWHYTGVWYPVKPPSGNWSQHGRSGSWSGYDEDVTNNIEEESAASASPKSSTSTRNGKRFGRNGARGVSAVAASSMITAASGHRDLNSELNVYKYNWIVYYLFCTVLACLAYVLWTWSKNHPRLQKGIRVSCGVVHQLVWKNPGMKYFLESWFQLSHFGSTTELKPVDESESFNGALTDFCTSQCTSKIE